MCLTWRLARGEKCKCFRKQKAKCRKSQKKLFGSYELYKLSQFLACRSFSKIYRFSSSSVSSENQFNSEMYAKMSFGSFAKDKESEILNQVTFTLSSLILTVWMTGSMCHSELDCNGEKWDLWSKINGSLWWAMFPLLLNCVTYKGQAQKKVFGRARSCWIAKKRIQNWYLHGSPPRFEMQFLMRMGQPRNISGRFERAKVELVKFSYAWIREIGSILHHPASTACLKNQSSLSHSHGKSGKTSHIWVKRRRGMVLPLKHTTRMQNMWLSTSLPGN